mmetsp:Transcript_2501/g.8908  ORF Transcript_2501/g.8908 Transcript_2501/m.8908 type:complete len:229 (+) Transcript_2501:488-1174(+)
MSSAPSPSSVTSAHMKKRSLLPNATPWACLTATTDCSRARTPVSSATSRTAASVTSSPCSTRPVGTFQKPGLAAGPRCSRTRSTCLLLLSTKAPTPTWCEALGGSVHGSEAPSGSHAVSMTWPRSAWWKSRPADTATGKRAACERGTGSHTPRTPAARHAARLAWSRASNSDASDGRLSCDTTTPPYVSALCSSSAVAAAAAGSAEAAMRGGARARAPREAAPRPGAR